MAKKKSKKKKEGIDYSELSWKMDKYMSDEPESMEEYYDLLDSGSSDNKDDVASLEEFFDCNIIDEERFDSYMPKGGTLKGFCKYLLEKNEKYKKKEKRKK